MNESSDLALVTKIDLGCGKGKKEGFFGIDQYAMAGVDLVLDLGRDRWPFLDGSITEAHCSHFLEHLGPKERVHFMNELYRVLKLGGTALIITPYWASMRAYGDLTHAWPPISEMSFFYFRQEWRDQNAPHMDKKWNPDGLSCHFAFTLGYNLHAQIQSRNTELQQLAVTFCKEAAQDILATLTKEEPLPA